MKIGKINNSQDGIVHDTNGEIQCLSSGHGNVPKILVNEKNNGGIIQINLSTESNGIQPYQQNRVYDTNGIMATLSNGNGGNTVPKILVKSNTKQGFETAKEGDSINLSMPNSKTRRGRVGVGVGVAQTLDTQVNQSVVVAQRGRYNKEGKTEQQLEVNNTDTTNTLTGVQKDNMLFLEGSIRRLSEIECERLQGFQDNHTKYGIYPENKLSQKEFNKLTNNQKIEYINTLSIKKEISRTQRYKMCGNAVTVNIVKLVGIKLIQNF